MNTLWCWFATKAARWVVLSASLLVIFFYRAVVGLASVPIHPDEFIYVHHGNWLSEFWRGAGSVYRVSGDTLRDPPVVAYLVGVVLRLNGQAEAPAYFVAETPAGWSAEGAFLPDGSQLWLMRFPMAALFVLAVAASLALVRRVVPLGVVALTGLALAASEYLLMHTRRVMTEAPMVALLTALMLVSALGWHTLGSAPMRRAIVWAGMLGLITGLGIVSKHNLAVNLPVLFGWVFAARVLGRRRPARQGLAQGAGLSFVAVAVALGVFVGLTPILHTDTLHRLGLMLAERRRLIQHQQQTIGPALITLGQRLDTSARRTLNHYLPINCARNRGQRLFWSVTERRYRHLPNGTPSPLLDTPLCIPLFGWVTPIALTNLALVGLGLWSLGRTFFRAPSSAAMLVYGGVNVVVAVVLIPLDWDRYHILPVFFATTLSAVGCAEVFRGFGKFQTKTA